YVRTADSVGLRRAAGLCASLALLALAMLFKAPAIAVPIVLLILDYHPLRRLGGGPGRWFGRQARWIWGEKIPFLLLSVVFAVAAIRAKAATGSALSLEQRGPLSRIGLAGYGICFYIWKTFFPAGLYAYYAVPAHVDWRTRQYVTCVTLVAVASGVLLIF